MLVYLFIFDQFAEDISDWVITFNCIMIFYKMQDQWNFWSSCSFMNSKKQIEVNSLVSSSIRKTAKYITKKCSDSKRLFCSID